MKINLNETKPHSSSGYDSILWPVGIYNLLGKHIVVGGFALSTFKYVFIVTITMMIQNNF